jgi:hypothetical protein
MLVPEPVLVALIGLGGVLLAGLLADIAVWRRSLSRDLRQFDRRLTTVETIISFTFPGAARRAARKAHAQEVDQ